jgi:hypothetical protein
LLTKTCSTMSVALPICGLSYNRSARKVQGARLIVCVCVYVGPVSGWPMLVLWHLMRMRGVGSVGCVLLRGWNVEVTSWLLMFRCPVSLFDGPAPAHHIHVQGVCWRPSHSTFFSSRPYSLSSLSPRLSFSSPSGRPDVVLGASPEIPPIRPPNLHTPLHARHVRGW